MSFVSLIILYYSTLCKIPSDPEARCESENILMPIQELQHLQRLPNLLQWRRAYTAHLQGQLKTGCQQLVAQANLAISTIFPPTPLPLPLPLPRIAFHWDAHDMGNPAEGNWRQRQQEWREMLILPPPPFICCTSWRAMG